MKSTKARPKNIPKSTINGMKRTLRSGGIGNATEMIHRTQPVLNKMMQPYLRIVSYSKPTVELGGQSIHHKPSPPPPNLIDKPKQCCNPYAVKAGNISPTSTRVKNVF